MIDGRARCSIYNNVGATSLLTTAEDMVKWVGNFAHPTVGDTALIEQVSTLGKLTDGSAVNYAFGLAAIRGRRSRDRHSQRQGRGLSVVRRLCAGPDFGFFLGTNSSFNLRPVLDRITEIYIGNGPADDGWPTADRYARRVAEGSSPAAIRTSACRCWNCWSRTACCRFVPATEQVPAEFWSDGTFGYGPHYREHFRIVRDAAGKVSGVERVSIRDLTQLSYRRIQRAVVPGPESFRDVLGDYRSGELDITYTLTLEDGRLLMRSLWTTQPIVVTPRERDRFELSIPEAGECVMFIERDAAARVTAFDSTAVAFVTCCWSATHAAEFLKPHFRTFDYFATPGSLNVDRIEGRLRLKAS